MPARLALLALTVAVAARASADPHAPAGKGQEVFTLADVVWKDGPATLPKGAKIAVLEGDPTKDGEFVMRLRLPDGMRIAPHTHPKDERVTVIAGTLHLGMGRKFDERAATAMPAGSYGKTLAGMAHFGWVSGDTVLQLHGTGPWGVVYLDPADDPRNQK